MLKAFYVFNSSGTLLFNHDITREKTDPKLVSAFLSAICIWAEMYSRSGLSLFQTGSIKFLFERSIYSTDLVFTLASTVDHDDREMKEKVQNLRENFVHFFWEDRDALEKGIISEHKLGQFKNLIEETL